MATINRKPRKTRQNRSLNRTKKALFDKSIETPLLPDEAMPMDSPKLSQKQTLSKKKAFEKSKQIHRGKIITEIIETEKSFLKQIKQVNLLYRKPLEDAKILPSSVIAHQIFPGLIQLITLHEDFLEKIENEISKYSIEDRYKAQIADTFLNFSSFMKIHSDYAPKHAKASEVNHYFQKKTKKTPINLKEIYKMNN